MASESDINRTVQQLLSEVSNARSDILRADEQRSRAIDDLKKLIDVRGKPVGQVVDDLGEAQKHMAARLARMGAAVDELSKKIGRPGSSDGFDGADSRASAIGMLEQKHALRTLKSDPQHPYCPGETEIEEAELAVKAIRHLMKADLETLPLDQRKALSSFTLGSSGFILPPEMSSQILSCLVDTTDVSALVANTSISGHSIKFMVDNVQLDLATWACDSDCWGQSAVKSLLDELGELEIKPEPLRYVLCASRDLVEDADVDIETWLTGKISRAIRATVSDAVMKGDGIGKPLGILAPQGGIPIAETGAGTPAGQFTWQDLVMLKYAVPMQYHPRGRYFMNQTTFALTLTMSDAMGRPIMIPTPVQNGEFTIAGSPVSIVTQMPDCTTGATPVAFGDWSSAYTVVNRKAVTMQQDPYTAGFCLLFKFEARIGGSVTCPNAAKLMRVR